MKKCTNVTICMSPVGRPTTFHKKLSNNYLSVHYYSMTPDPGNGHIDRMSTGSLALSGLIGSPVCRLCTIASWLMNRSEVNKTTKTWSLLTWYAAFFEILSCCYVGITGRIILYVSLLKQSSNWHIPTCCFSSSSVACLFAFQVC